MRHDLRSLERECASLRACRGMESLTAQALDFKSAEIIGTFVEDFKHGYLQLFETAPELAIELLEELFREIKSRTVCRKYDNR